MANKILDDLKEIRSQTTDFFQANQQFIKEKRDFDTTLEEKKNLVGDNSAEICLSNLLSYGKSNSSWYDLAVNFYKNNKIIFEKARLIQEKKPVCADVIFKRDLIKEVTEALDVTFGDEQALEKIKTDINTFMMLEDCGFSKLYILEQEVKGMAREIGLSSKGVSSQIGDAIIRTGKNTISTVATVAKPYGEAAREQLGETKEKVKGIVNKSSKGLIKVLRKIEDKTSNE